MAPLPLTSKQQDNRILAVFAVFVFLGMALPAAVFLFVTKTSMLQLIGSTLSGLSTAFVFAGILSFHYHRKNAIISRRRFWRGVTAAASGCAIASTAIILIANASRPDLLNLPSSTTVNMAIVIPSLMLGFFLASMLILLYGLLLAFGGIGVMVAIGRKVTPWVLLQIIDSGSRDKMSPEDRLINWLFDIPAVLDTRTLRIGPVSREGKIRWTEIEMAVLWELFFGVILAIYLSFNPFISDRSPTALLGIFGILISGSVLIPMIILPWHVFRRLDARIEGVTKDFALYDGIRSRLFQSYLAIGTIIILIRLSISTIDAGTYLMWFTAFVVVLFGISVAFTFVYFNYFEEGLVENISSSFERKRETETPQP
jgi:hypothetical protein